MSDDAFDVLEALAKQLNFNVDALPDDATKAAGFIRCRADRRTLLFLYPDGWDFSRGRDSEPLACVGAVDPNEMPSPTTEWGCSVSIPGGDPENDAQRGIFDTMREAMDTAERWAKELRAEADATATDATPATPAATKPAPYKAKSPTFSDPKENKCCEVMVDSTHDFYKTVMCSRERYAMILDFKAFDGNVMGVAIISSGGNRNQQEAGLSHLLDVVHHSTAARSTDFACPPAGPAVANACATPVATPVAINADASNR